MSSELWLDFETRSNIDLKKRGLDVYADDPSTTVLMCAYASDEARPSLWEPHLAPIPAELNEALRDPRVLKVAWNANFERTTLDRQLDIRVPLTQFFDPMALSKSLGFPGALGNAAVALEADDQKAAGNALVKMFSCPSKATKPMLKKGSPPIYFKDWVSHPEDWRLFCDYCLQDVEAERSVWNSLSDFRSALTPDEHKAWLLDQAINQRGVWVDDSFVRNGIDIAAEESERLLEQMKTMTGLMNPNSVQQLGKWLRDRGYPFDSIDQDSVTAALTMPVPDQVREVLLVKQTLGGTAYKKLQTILDRVGSDGRLRDQFSYHGAHTGRWSSHGVQLQNLSKPSKPVKQKMDELVESIRTNTYRQNGIATMDVIGGLVRASFRAAPGHHLVVGDLSQIESRVLAWLAGCQSMMDAYARGEDLYVQFIAKVLQKDPALVDEMERAQGKVGILGCGFSMGPPKFQEYALGYGVHLTEEDAKKLVLGFRETYPEVVTLWNDCDHTFKYALEDQTRYGVSAQSVVIDCRRKDMARIVLPSGRALSFYQAIVSIESSSRGPRQVLSYQSYGERGNNRTRLYGGKIVENIVQAIARDCLRDAMFAAHQMGFRIILHAHDEIVAEVPDGSPLTLDNLLDCMKATPSWAPGLLIDAKGWEGQYYKKD